MVDLSLRGTQEQFAALVGVSQQAVSALAARGVLPPAENLGSWLLSYCDHLRESAVARGGSEGAALAQERAALARAQTERVEMQNAERRRNLAPSSILRGLLARAAVRAARELETIPADVRGAISAATAEDMRAVVGIVEKARRVILALRRADLFGEHSAREAQDLDDFDTDPA